MVSIIMARLPELEPHPDRPGDDPDGDLTELEAMRRKRLEIPERYE